MNREKAIEIFKRLKENAPNEMHLETVGTEQELFDMAIQALSQEPCDDAISRNMALEKMADYVASGYADSVEDFEEYSRIICQLPSVTQKSGKWIPVSKRLPEEGRTVIASTEYGVYGEARYTKEYGWEWPYEAGADYWRELEGVTAWMPLPEPYKVEPQESNDKCKNCEYYRNPDYTRCHECEAERSGEKMKLRTKSERKAYLDGYEMCAHCIEEHLTDEGKQKLECLLMAVRNALEIEDIEPQESEDKE